MSLRPTLAADVPTMITMTAAQPTTASSCTKGATPASAYASAAASEAVAALRWIRPRSTPRTCSVHADPSHQRVLPRLSAYQPEGLSELPDLSTMNKCNPGQAATPCVFNNWGPSACRTPWSWSPSDALRDLVCGCAHRDRPGRHAGAECQHEHPAYTAEVLERVDDAGIPVVFVTGRPLRWMETLWPHIGKHGLAVVSNGAVTYDVHDREVVTTTGIEPALGLDLAAAINSAVPGSTSRSSPWTGSGRTRTSSTAIACQQGRGVAHLRTSGTGRR